MTILIEKASVEYNATSKISWLTSSITLDTKIEDYSGSVNGLMGNLNGDLKDDIRSRDLRPPKTMNESDIYDIAIDCIIYLNF